jgi:hypothetical protein
MTDETKTSKKQNDGDSSHLLDRVVGLKNSDDQTRCKCGGAIIKTDGFADFWVGHCRDCKQKYDGFDGGILI